MITAELNEGVSTAELKSVTILSHWQWSFVEDKLQRANQIERVTRRGEGNHPIQRALGYDSGNLRPTLEQAMTIFQELGLSNSIRIRKSRQGRWRAVGVQGERIIMRPFLGTNLDGRTFTDGGAIFIYHKQPNPRR